MKTNLDRNQPPIRTRYDRHLEAFAHLRHRFDIELKREALKHSITDPAFAEACRAAVKAHDDLERIMFGGKP